MKNHSSSGPHGHLGERPVRLGLLSSQKLHWHARTIAGGDARPAALLRTPAAPPSGVPANQDQSQRHFLYRNYNRWLQARDPGVSRMYAGE